MINDEFLNFHTTCVENDFSIFRFDVDIMLKKLLSKGSIVKLLLRHDVSQSTIKKERNVIFRHRQKKTFFRTTRFPSFFIILLGRYIIYISESTNGIKCFYVLYVRYK